MCKSREMLQMHVKALSASVELSLYTVVNTYLENILCIYEKKKSNSVLRY